MKALTDDPLQRMIFTLRFFTRLPVPARPAYQSDLAENAIWFPIAGLVVGALAGLIWWLACLALPPAIAAGLAIAAGILITGGLHEDGFADCADGLGGGFTREKALEIMRDSRIGAYGAMALIFTIGLRWMALATFAPWSGAFALISAHILSRAMIALPLAISKYARTKGLGSTVSSGTDIVTFALALALSAVIAILLTGMAGIITAAIAFILCWLFLQHLETRLGGYTGDGLGAIQQIAEITILISLAGFAA